MYINTMYYTCDFKTTKFLLPGTGRLRRTALVVQSKGHCTCHWDLWSTGPRNLATPSLGIVQNDKGIAV